VTDTEEERETHVDALKDRVCYVTDKESVRHTQRVRQRKTKREK